MMGHRGRTVRVTGASRGLGRDMTLSRAKSEFTVADVLEPSGDDERTLGLAAGQETNASPATAVSEAVVDALTARMPPARYRTGTEQAT